MRWISRICVNLNWPSPVRRKHNSRQTPAQCKNHYSIGQNERKFYPQPQAMKAKDHFLRTFFGHTGMERLLRRFIELISTRDVRAASVPPPSGPKTQKAKE